jgi:hypothetical protein
MKSITLCAIALSLAACGQDASGPDPVQQAAQEIEAVPPGETIPAAPIEAGEYKILGPFVHANLSVFLIQKPGAPKGEENYLTLEEGLKSGAVKVTEKADGQQVNKLEVENVGDRPVYLQAGDTVKGGQQDRTIGVDFILKPKSGKTTVDAFCVEPGRWASRTEGGVATGGRFAYSSAPVATKEQKLAIKGSQSQAQVWEAGRTANSGLARNARTLSTQDSYVLAAEDPKVKERTEEYVKALVGAVEAKEELVGMAFAVNGEANTAEIYATTSLFLKLWPKLLRSASVEAFAKKSEKPVEKTASASDIAALLSEAGKGEGRVQALSGEIRMKAYTGKKVTLFDTEKSGELLHRQVIQR